MFYRKLFFISLLFVYSFCIYSEEASHHISATFNKNQNSTYNPIGVCIPESHYIAGRSPVNEVFSELLARATSNLSQNENTGQYLSKTISNADSDIKRLRLGINWSSKCLGAKTGLPIKTIAKRAADDSDPSCECRVVPNISHGLPNKGFLAASCSPQFSKEHKNDGLKSCHLFYPKNCKVPTKIFLLQTANRFGCESWVKEKYPQINISVTSQEGVETLHDLVDVINKRESDVKTKNFDVCSAVVVPDITLEYFAREFSGRFKKLKAATEEQTNEAVPSLIFCSSERMASQFQQGLTKNSDKSLSIEERNYCNLTAPEIGLSDCVAPSDRIRNILEQRKPL